MITFNLVFETASELVEVVKSLAKDQDKRDIIADKVKDSIKQAEEAEIQHEEEMPKVKVEKKKDPEPEAASEPEPAPAPVEKAKLPTTQDVRNAMQATRDRLEFGTPAPGADKGPNAEADDEIHRALTKEFKAIAHSIGGCKPSELPEEQRQEFIDRLATLQVNADKTITPF